MSIVCVRTSAADIVPQMFPSLILWSIDMPAQPLSSPVAAGDVIAIPLQSGEIAAWRLSDRTLAWTAKLPIQGPLASANDRIIVQTKDSIVALAAATGKPVWTVTAGSLTAPILARGGWVVVATAEELTALRLTDGAKVWGQSFGQIERRPSIEGDRLYVPIADGRLLALDLESGILRWTRQLGGPPTETLALADRVYLGAGSNFFCLRTRDGVIDWRWHDRYTPRRPPGGGCRTRLYDGDGQSASGDGPGQRQRSLEGRSRSPAGVRTRRDRLDCCGARPRGGHQGI